MKSGLRRVKNWAGLAHAAGYKAGVLADRCEVSIRSLERFFRRTTGISPQKWLKQLRQYQALRLMHGSRSLKEIAHELGSNHPSHFSRDFKITHGVSPAQHTPGSPPPGSVAFW